MNWEWYLAQLVNRSIDILPWLVAGLSGLAVVSFSPLGRGLNRYLRGRREEMAITEQMLGEMQELRKVLDEISERLDFTERRLAQHQLEPPRPRALAEKFQSPAPETVAEVTPH
jgi:hypothetical protein